MTRLLLGPAALLLLYAVVAHAPPWVAYPAAALACALWWACVWWLVDQMQGRGKG